LWAARIGQPFPLFIRASRRNSNEISRRGVLTREPRHTGLLQTQPDNHRSATLDHCSACRGTSHESLRITGGNHDSWGSESLVKFLEQRRGKFVRLLFKFGFIQLVTAFTADPPLGGIRPGARFFWPISQGGMTRRAHGG
jgi:hypothetical protein